MERMLRTVCLALLILTLFACSSDEAKQYDLAGVNRRYQTVYDLTKDPSCADLAVCSSIGIGSKPCGGPWRHLVYSTATVDAETLKTAVADLNAYEAGYNRQEGLMSDCSVAPAAKLACVNRLCVDLNAAL